MPHQQPPVQELVVCYLLQKSGTPEEQMFLGLRVSGKTFPDIWNGPGGKIEPGENPRQAAYRELTQEIADIETNEHELHKLATMECSYRTIADSEKNLVLRVRVHFFWCEMFTGEPRRRREQSGYTFSKVHWFPTNQLPLREMMKDQEWWIQNALRQRKRMIIECTQLHVSVKFDDTNPLQSQFVREVTQRFVPKG